MTPELQPIPQYEPPAKGIREPDEHAEERAETWRAWLEDEPLT
jgi:hypothetical protein